MPAFSATRHDGGSLSGEHREMERGRPLAPSRRENIPPLALPAMRTKLEDKLVYSRLDECAHCDRGLLIQPMEKKTFQILDQTLINSISFENYKSTPF